MRPLRLAARVGLVLGGVALVYLAVTGFQVWRAANEDQAGRADAIVVLGAAQYDGRPSPVYRARLDHAAELYAQDLAPMVLVTGGRRPGDRFTEAAAGAGYLAAHGVPEEAIVLESGGSDSWTSLQAAARVLGDRRHVLLVSSPYHALRTRHIAGEVGLDGRSSPSVDHEGALERVWHLGSETLRVGAGRLLGYGRLVRLGDKVG